jgi:4-amino-4-deoxy-L-arabinose transferase-like glycosyltransferase
MSHDKRSWAIALGLVGLALGLRLYGIGWGLPQVYEEAYPFKKAWDMWGWGPRDEFTLNPRFFNYPTFFFYVQLAGQALLYVMLSAAGTIDSTLDYRVLYTLDKTSFYLMGRTISALFGVATVLATGLLGRRVGGSAVGIGAAFLVAVNQMHIAKSQVIEVDVPLTLFATLCAWFAVRILERPTWRNYLLAGLCAGLATSTKYSGALLPLTLLVAHLLAPRGGRAAATGAGGRKARRPATAPAPAPARDLRKLAAALAVAGASLFLTSPYILLDQKAFWIGFNYERLHMRLGHFGLDQTPAIVYYLRVMTGPLLGWPLALLGVAGMVHALVVRRARWAVVLAVFPVVYLTLISSWSMKADRYILPLLPIMAVFATAVVAAFVPRLQGRRRWAPAAAAAGLVAVMAAPSIWAYAHERDRFQPDTRTLSRQWIEANVPGGSFIVCEAYGPEVLGAVDVQGLDKDVRERIEKHAQDIRVYALVGLPMYQVMPENSALCYDLRLYQEAADLIVTSSSVASRYRREPQRYAAQLGFYSAVESSWKKVREFGPQDGSGPRITIYRHPQERPPFSKRGAPPPPAPPVVPDLLPGSIGGFFERLGFNYEAYGFHAAALEIFSMGLRYQDQPADIARSLRLGAVRNAVRLGQAGRVLALIDEGEKRAAGPAGAEYWRKLRAQLLSGTPAASSTP